jgi:general secretion pathway protein G
MMATLSTADSSTESTEPTDRPAGVETETIQTVQDARSVPEGTAGARLQPGDKAAAQRAHVERDLVTLRSALRVYYMTALTFPSTDQGLDALAKRPTRGRVPKGYKPILESERLDPWGNPYGYRFPPTRSKDVPDIWSFGADKIDATEDDFGNWDVAERLKSEDGPTIVKKIRGSWGLSEEGFLKMIKASEKVAPKNEREKFAALADAVEILFDKLVYEFDGGTVDVFETSGSANQHTFSFLSANGAAGAFVIVLSGKDGSNKAYKGKLSADTMLLEQREMKITLIRLSDEESTKRKEAIKNFDPSLIQSFVQRPSSPGRVILPGIAPAW